MRSHARLAVTVVLLIVPGLAGSAGADPVRIPFVVDVRETFGNLEDIFGAPLVAGDVLRGTLTYDAAVPDSDPNPAAGLYQNAGTLAFFLGSGLSLPPADVLVFDQVFTPIPGVGDDVLIGGGFTTTFPGFDSIDASLDLRGTGRPGDALPATLADVLAAFTTGSFRLIAFQTGGDPPFDRGTHEVLGVARLVDDQAAPVPEPGTLVLFAIGAGLLARRYRRGQA
jgi:hypothetical protein